MARKQATGLDSQDVNWRSLYQAGGWAALAIVALMAVQIVVFVAWPPPETALDWFARFQDNWLLGLLNFDLLYLVTNILLVPMYLALYMALRKVNEAWMSIALILGLMGITAYFASITAFEMLSLSNQYAAGTDAEKSAALAAGQAMLAIYKGTAFDVYYILNAVFLLIVSAVMLRSDVFSKATAYWGLLCGLLMAIPSTAGAIGPIFALASLAPWAVFSVLVALRLFRLGSGAPARRAYPLPKTR